MRHGRSSREEFPGEARPGDSDPLCEHVGRDSPPGTQNASDERFEDLIETFRQYLLMVASSHVDTKLRGKFGASDIVQETLVTAHQEAQSFGGSTPDELRLWLKRILLNKLANTRRRFVHNSKREVAREVPMGTDATPAEEFPFVDPNPTPRQNALSVEMHEVVKRAIERLSPRDQELIKLRSFELQSFAEIGQQLDMSSEAARKAWCRAIERFRVIWRQVNHQD